MLKEYAVDPEVLGGDFEMWRYLSGQFGVEKGRLISRFPNDWKRRAINAADVLPDGLRKERIITYLQELNAESLTMIRSRRAYGAPANSWLDNAKAAHGLEPFAAIIADQDDPPHGVISAESCDPRSAPFAAATTRVVARTADALAEPARLLLQNCRTVRFVDAYFDARKSIWREPLGRFLSYIPDIATVSCEFHTLERPDSRPPDLLKEDLTQLKDAIPKGGSLRIVRWRQKPAGERFHARYVMTESAGLAYEGGLDAVRGADQTTDVSVLAPAVHRQRWEALEPTADVYELVRPVLEVDSEGAVTEVNP